MYVLANEPSVALYRLQEHVRRSLPELAQHKSDMQSWEEQSQGAIYTVEYACRYVQTPPKKRGWAQQHGFGAGNEAACASLAPSWWEPGRSGWGGKLRVQAELSEPRGLRFDEVPARPHSCVRCRAASAIKNMTDSSVYFKSIDSLLKHAIAMKDQLNAAQGRR
ncbi:Protein MEF2BNB isoform X1 [Aix galericulata]|nr:Protein MEF2BNB isoform X1 [Aix galericulata]